MTYRGRVESGRVVFEDPIMIPEGAEVTVEYVTRATNTEPEPDDPFHKILELAGPTGIPDLAANRDHDLYGLPKIDDDEG